MGIPSISTSCFSTVTFILLGPFISHPSFMNTNFLRDGRCCLSSGRVELLGETSFEQFGAVLVDCVGSSLLQLGAAERPAGHDRGHSHPSLLGGLDVPDRVADYHGILGRDLRPLQGEPEDVGGRL